VFFVTASSSTPRPTVMYPNPLSSSMLQSPPWQLSLRCPPALLVALSEHLPWPFPRASWPHHPLPLTDWVVDSGSSFYTTPTASSLFHHHPPHPSHPPSLWATVPPSRSPQYVHRFFRDHSILTTSLLLLV
jgi:hypothetical protein